MENIIEEVISSENEKKTDSTNIIPKKTKRKKKKNNTLNPSLTRDTNIRNIVDKELEAVLSSLTTIIKVVGCGGAGTNTISRCVASGITGAELIAVNTDAQHLLMTKSPKKVLIGW